MKEKGNVNDFEVYGWRRASLCNRIFGNCAGCWIPLRSVAIAQRLGLGGFVQNMPDETVYAEIEGQKVKILFLIEQMKSIPRIQITNVEINEMGLKNESEFKIAN